MKAIGKYLVIGLAILLSAWVLGKSYTYKYRTQDRIVVTGLGETEFTSDLIVWRGMVCLLYTSDRKCRAYRRRTPGLRYGLPPSLRRPSRRWRAR